MRSQDGGTRRDAGPVGLEGGPPDAPMDGSASRDAGAGSLPRPDGGSTVRFVVMGDTGEGNAAQREVAVAVRDLCAAEGCDFVLLLGDNIYESGVDGPGDAQWQSKFEEPYRDIELPFYAVLGNHDYGGSLLGWEQGGMGNEFDKGPQQVAYTEHSSKWTMPATHYTFQVGHVGFVVLDTNSILWDNVDHGDQRAWYPAAVAQLRNEGAEWIVVAGHHPHRSNGRHGNAGNYESIEVAGVEVPNPVPILDGEHVKEFFDDLVCGTADVYLAGHDHNRQWLDEPEALCGAELIVSGAGAKTTPFASSLNEAEFGDDMVEGFLYTVIAGDRMYGRFVDRDGRTAFEREVARPRTR